MSQICQAPNNNTPTTECVSFNHASWILLWYWTVLDSLWQFWTVKDGLNLVWDTVCPKASFGRPKPNPVSYSWIFAFFEI